MSNPSSKWGYFTSSNNNDDENMNVLDESTQPNDTGLSFIERLKKSTQSSQSSNGSSTPINTNKRQEEEDDYQEFDENKQQPPKITNPKVRVTHYPVQLDSDDEDSSNKQSNKRKEMGSSDNNSNDDRPTKKLHISQNQSNNNNNDDLSLDISLDLQPSDLIIDNEDIVLCDDENDKNDGSKYLKYRWQWASDKGWEDYSNELMYKIEESFKGNVFKFKVDNERYIQFGDMTQRRNDSLSKQRKVRRIEFKTPVLVDIPTSNTTNTKPTNSSPPTKLNNSSPIKLNNNTNTNTNNNNNTTNNNQKVKWGWKDDNQKWIEYNDDICSELEKSLQSRKKGIKVQIDNDRFVDLDNMQQKRYDSASKFRVVKRFDPSLNTTSNTNTNSSSGLSIKSNISANTNTNILKQLNQNSNQQIDKQTTPPKPTTSTISNKSSSISTNTNSTTNRSSSSLSNSSSKPSNNSFSHGQWFWNNDVTFVEYSKEINEIIEDNYHNGVKSFEIDLGNGDIKIIDLEHSCQRRKDDNTRRRQIIRKVPLSFDANQGKFNTGSNSNNNSTTSNKTSSNNNNNSSNSKGTPTTTTPIQKQSSKVFTDDDLFDNPSDNDADDDLSCDIEYSKLPNPKDPTYLTQKRKLYECGDKYLKPEDIRSWYEILEVNRHKASASTIKPLRKPKEGLNKKIALHGGNIETLEIDAIVNAARDSLRGGGGIDGVIHNAAGALLVNECIKLGGCKVGDAKITKGYRLPAKHVIHTVGPQDQDPKKLEACYDSCLKIVLQNKIKTVAFCCIATGVYGFPNKDAAEIAVRKVRDWLEINHQNVDKVIFCIFTTDDYKLYGRKLQEYFPIN